jgi:hypothetical protein
MKWFTLLLLLCACSITRVKGYVKTQSTIKICGNALTNFDDIEDEAENICGRYMSVLECDYEVSGYLYGSPVKGPCCAVFCPQYANRRRHD